MPKTSDIRVSAWESCMAKVSKVVHRCMTHSIGIPLSEPVTSHQPTMTVDGVVVDVDDRNTTRFVREKVMLNVDLK